MLTRVVFALVLMGGLATAARAGEAKVRKLGLADHAVTEAELAKGVPPAPKFNTPAVAYALVANVKKGDAVAITLNNGDKALLRNEEMLAEDKASYLLQAGKGGVPAGGWPEGTYSAAVIVTRDGKPLLTETSKPIPFE
jgi:hypothetical protein